VALSGLAAGRTALFLLAAAHAAAIFLAALCSPCPDSCFHCDISMFSFRD
jgi:hypothetical protein